MIGTEDLCSGGSESGKQSGEYCSSGGVKMTGDCHDSFRFLQQFWPDLHDFGRKAEQAGALEPDLAAIRLRGFTEAMVSKLLSHLGLQYDPAGSHFDRLILLENADLLDARLLSKFHAIRKIGNNAAHNGRVTQAKVEDLLEDAWSLSCWFCRFMRPDVEWFTPARQNSYSAPSSSLVAGGDVSVERQPTVPGNPTNVLKFPEDRIRRIREQVSQAMSQVAPKYRQLRTSITLHEAFTENLSDDQTACLHALSAFLEDPTQRVFLLKGYAGTGKTFLAKGITEFLSAQGRAFRLSAPTGRAAKIIAAKTRRDARTVHGSIYNFGDLKEYKAEDQEPGSETFKYHAEIASNRDQANTVYIIDEASLLSDAYSESEFFRSGTGYLLHDLITFAGFSHGETDRKIIFVGDPAQLPPVGTSVSPALDADYLRKQFGVTVAEYELKQVLRQKAESGVIRNVMPLRESLAKSVFSSLRFEFDGDVQRLRADETVSTYMAVRSPSLSSAIVITQSNKEAAGYNKAIRSALFPGREFVAAGDRLIVTANAFLNGNFLANGEFVEVVAAEQMVERRSVTLRRRNELTGLVETVDVSLLFRDVELAVSMPDGEETVVTAKILDDHLSGGGGLESAQQRALYVDFLKRHPDLKHCDRREVGLIIRQDPYFNALRVKFGYAVTCHKAQGGEWEYVFVSCPPGQDPRTAEYFRWLYTAMTRSSAKLYLVEPPEVKIKVVGNWVGLDAGTKEPDPKLASEDQPSVTPVQSPQEAFRLELLERVRGILSGKGIEIDDVALDQYQEAFYRRRDLDTARVNISYNGSLKITAVTVPPANAFREELGQLLRPLAGTAIGSGGRSLEKSGASGVQMPSRPFLAAFHDRLLPPLRESQIEVIGLKEQVWSQRYTFARDNESVVVDVYYDGRDRIKSCAPLNIGGRPPPETLLRDVLDILTSQVAP